VSTAEAQLAKAERTALDNLRKIRTAQGKDMRGGHNKKTEAQHEADGTRRTDRHGPVPAPTANVSTRDRKRDFDHALIEQAGDWASRWSRGTFDEAAISDGAWFDIHRACFAVWWIERYCRLYEGEYAGEPLLLRGAHSQWPVDPILSAWGPATLAKCEQRSSDYLVAFDAGETVDWQYEAVMRTYGWVMWDEDRSKWSRRYKKASYWVAKKNKKSPTMAANMLYITVGDGEKGQNTFVGSKNATQVMKNVMRHMIAMVEQSPELAAECKIHKANKTIEHLPSRSAIWPMAGGDKRHKEALEGINGSLGIDETHVVDRDFMQITKRLGISRSEPMLQQFSTTGDDPDCYGHDQWKYCEAILDGSIIDHHYLAIMYAPPQDTTDEQLIDDPMKFAAMANPALGHTVFKTELLSDFKESSLSPVEFASCKKYRFQIWQQSANPWLPISSWDACKSDRTLGSFAGQHCWLGGDFSRSRDMSAIVATFRDDDGDQPEFYQFAWAWIVEGYARANKDKAEFLRWEQDGHLEFCDTVIRYSQIKAVIREIHSQTPITEFRHDEHMTGDMIYELDEELGITGVPFAQSITGYAKPVDDMEAAIKSKTVHHDGNPVYRWQMQHAYAKPAVNNPDTKRIVKPSLGEVKKVDIVQSGIMSLSGAMAADTDVSVYATRGVFYLGDDE